MFIPQLLISTARSEMPRLLYQAWESGSPHLQKLLADPLSTVERIGDALVWNGETGQRVIGGLESLSESQSRIEHVVNGIEAAQLGVSNMLGVVEVASIATLGVSSLTGAFMAYRLNALNKRVAQLSQTLKDVDGKLDAMHRAHLRSALIFLGEYDDNPSNEIKLDRALDEARQATNIYTSLVTEETNTKPRLSVLNCRSRFFVTALLTELRCLISADDAKTALSRIEQEKPVLKHAAKACFEQTLKISPERFLRSAFRPHGVSLSLLSEIYRQAARLGVIDEPKVCSPEETFEFMRESLSWSDRWSNWWSPSSLQQELTKLRYLLCSLEEASKIEGLALLIHESKNQNQSIADWIRNLTEWRSKQENEGTAKPGSTYAYAFSS